MQVAIEEVEVDDYALTRDEKTGQEIYKPVTELFRNKVDYIRKLGFSDNTELEVTWNHPIYVRGKGWTEVKDISVGDRVILSSNRDVVITYNNTVSSPDTIVYNFEVEDTHSYFAGANEVWVHNYDPRTLFRSNEIRAKINY